MPIIKWPPVRGTWEAIEKAVKKEFELSVYVRFPARKLAVMDYLLARFYALRAQVVEEWAVKEEGAPPYKY